MYIPPRQPYAGELVFTAFSGSHQDAIKKGMEYTKVHKKELWDVPYLPIDPLDIGRSYQAIIRINSQSGKGGVAYILEKEFGLQIPRSMQPELGALVNKVSDELIRELSAKELLEVLENEYIQVETPFRMGSYDIHKESAQGPVTFQGKVLDSGSERFFEGEGNGPIDAFTHGLKDAFGLDFSLEHFHEQAVGHGSNTVAVAYIEIVPESGKSYWGIGRDNDTSLAHFNALLVAVNRMMKG
jgi:2-isopropylmalate synthase